MIDEIEVDLERELTVWDGGSPEPARRDVERHLPPVVLHRGEHQACLADDLAPKLQGVAGILPRLQRESRPGLAGSGLHFLVCHDLHPSEDRACLTSPREPAPR